MLACRRTLPYGRGSEQFTRRSDSCVAANSSVNRWFFSHAPSGRMNLAPDHMELAVRRRVRKRDDPPSFAERVAHRAAVPAVL